MQGGRSMRFGSGIVTLLLVSLLSGQQQHNRGFADHDKNQPAQLAGHPQEPSDSYFPFGPFVVEQPSAFIQNAARDGCAPMPTFTHPAAVLSCPVSRP